LRIRARPSSAGWKPSGGKFIISIAPACTAPAPLTTPAIARSPGKRFWPGINVSAKASSVCVIARWPSPLPDADGTPIRHGDIVHAAASAAVRARKERRVKRNEISVDGARRSSSCSIIRCISLMFFSGVPRI
jgi:hypothetical protein